MQLSHPFRRRWIFLTVLLAVEVRSLLVQAGELYTADWGQPEKIKKLKVALHVG